MTYAILIHPGHNRVYFDTSQSLVAAEFALAAQRLPGCRDIAVRDIAGVPYLVFNTEDLLTAAGLRTIAPLSFFYALFLFDGQRLTPVAPEVERFITDNISSMLKYTGKTNELFTRMLINAADFSRSENGGNLRLLDPLAGKGTTLFEGLIRGWDVYGVEIGSKITAEAVRFLRRFLETARYKFECTTVRVSGENRSFTAERHTFSIARNKDEQRQKQIKTAEFIAGDAQYVHKYHKKNTFDIIVADLPYGVQHGAVTVENQTSLTKNPYELLKQCLPSWAEVLRPGGAIALSWNSLTLPRERIAVLLADNGLTVRQDGAYSQLQHRVDQGITRDAIVAVKAHR